MTDILSDTEAANSGETTPGGSRNAAPDFSPADLELLSRSEAPYQLRKAARLLLELAQEDAGEDGFARFDESLSAFSLGAVTTRATFRLCHAALDFLWTDFLAVEADHLQFLRGHVDVLEALQSAVPAVSRPLGSQIAAPDRSAQHAIWRTEWEGERAELRADFALLLHATPGAKVCAEIQRVATRIAELDLALGAGTTPAGNAI